MHVIAGFTDALELELEFMKKQIRTLKVCLGVVQTPLSRDFRDKVCPRWVLNAANCTKVQGSVFTAYFTVQWDLHTRCHTIRSLLIVKAVKKSIPIGSCLLLHVSQITLDINYGFYVKMISFFSTNSRHLRRPDDCGYLMPDYVAEKVVESIQTNRTFLLLPAALYPVLVLKLWVDTSITFISIDYLE